jgi:hypothetical protein
MTPELNEMEIEIENHDWLLDWDSFESEASAFERDVHMLILTGLDAGIKLLNTETQTENDKLIKHLPKAKGDAAEHLAQEQADMWIQLSQQETFLRNMALVALMSRLTHTLLSMLRHAEPWAPRNSDGYSGPDEFKRIWSDFRARFSLNINAKYIEWIDRYRRARNRIVHNGGEANPMRPFDEIDIDVGDEGIYDTSFSKKYRAFVSGSGFNAEVVVTEKLLNYAVKCAIRLVKHAAEELRRLELEHEQRQAAAIGTSSV